MSQLSCCQQTAHHSKFMDAHPACGFKALYICIYITLCVSTPYNSTVCTKPKGVNSLKLYFEALQTDFWLLGGKERNLQFKPLTTAARADVSFIVFCRWSHQLLCEIVKVSQRQLPEVLSCIGKTGEQLTGAQGPVQCTPSFYRVWPPIAPVGRELSSGRCGAEDRHTFLRSTLGTLHPRAIQGGLENPCSAIVLPVRSLRSCSLPRLLQKAKNQPSIFRKGSNWVSGGCF